VRWLPAFADAEPYLASRGAGDVVLVMGAGDVDELARSVGGG
jgi:UDP-N-acetylmuramate-alanine ligase